jgi:hypothetical protein
MVRSSGYGRCWAAANAAMVLSMPASVRSADLRITFSELTSLLQSIASSAKIYLNNVPSALPAGLFSSQSYVQITATQQYPVAIPVKSFDILGSKYGYFIKDVASTAVRVIPANGALRLVATFESEGPEAVAVCISGPCRLADILPDIQWDNATVNIDFVPIRFNGSISLEVRNVFASGTPRAVCKGTADFLERQACRLGLPFATRTIGQLKRELPGIIKAAANRQSIQSQLAEGLKRYLTLGQAGEVAINNISIDPKTLTIVFRFNAAAMMGSN